MFGSEKYYKSAFQKELEKRIDKMEESIRDQEERLVQLECNHPEDEREYSLWSYYMGFSFRRHFDYPMIEKCKLCGKEIKKYTQNEWKEKEIEIAEREAKKAQDKLKKLKDKKK